jgi:hypothetical protein
VNAANLRLLELQAAALETQARALERKRQQEMSERAATAGILRDTANARHDTTLDDQAIWVDAGGDPNVAIKYTCSIINRRQSSASRATSLNADQPRHMP